MAARAETIPRIAGAKEDDFPNGAGSLPAGALFPRPESGESAVRAGELIGGRWRVIRTLGRGGMGVVHEAVDEDRGEPVALKTLLPGMSGHAEVVRRFEREARALSILSHPSIVGVRDFGELPRGGFFLAMELARGARLAQLIDSRSLNPRDALGIGIQILDALEHAHSIGVVHRDLKPENVMVAEGAVKLVDFGVAKLLGDALHMIGGGDLTRVGLAFGSPDYMAPEQALGDRIDGRADLYAVGVLLFEMMAGRRPFQHPHVPEVLRMHVHEPPPLLRTFAPQAPPALERIVDRALAKDPAHRFAGAGEMAAALREVLAALDRRPAPALEAAPELSMSLRIAQQRRWPALLAIALVMSASIFAAFVGLDRPVAQPSPTAGGSGADLLLLGERARSWARERTLEVQIRGLSAPTCGARRRAVVALRELGDARALPEIAKLDRRRKANRCLAAEAEKTIAALRKARR